MKETLQLLNQIRLPEYQNYKLEDLVELYNNNSNNAIYAEIFIKLHKLIITKILKYQTQIKPQDCVSFAMESLYYSINTYKRDKNIKFTTYAIGNIERCFIREALRNNTYSRKIQYHTTFSLDYNENEKPNLEIKDLNVIDEFNNVDFRLVLTKLNLNDKEIFIINSIIEGKKVAEIKRELMRFNLDMKNINRLFVELKRKFSRCSDFKYVSFV